MPVFEYKALTAEGKVRTGVLDAGTPREARNRLRAEKVHVTELKPLLAADTARRARSWVPLRLSRRWLSEQAIITRLLATMLEAGIPLADALGAMIEQFDDRKLQGLFRDIREKVAQGSSFPDALANHPRYFSDLYINMVRAGDEAGSLPPVLKRLADYTRDQNRIHAKITAALAYPVIMLVIGTAVVFFLMIFVVPNITSMLTRAGKTLPLPTKILIGVSTFLATWWWAILAALAAAGVAWSRFIATEQGRFFFDKLKLRLPLLGELFKKHAISRFSHTFSTLYRSGIQVHAALGIVEKVAGNAVVARAIGQVADRVLEGADIATPLRESKVFPGPATFMIAMGADTGKLEETLVRLSDQYDEEIDITTQKVISMLEPLMIVCMAVVVGFIVLAIVLPIISMSKI